MSAMGAVLRAARADVVDPVETARLIRQALDEIEAMDGPAAGHNGGEAAG